jgi:uncharacterized protein
LLALQSIPDVLPGRSETIELWPLSQGEIDGEPDGFVDAVFSSDALLQARSTGLKKADYLTRIAAAAIPTRSGGTLRGAAADSSPAT